MSSFYEITNLFWTLKMEWNKTQPDFKKCNDMLMDIKIGMINHKFLPVNVEEPDLREYFFTRDILEIGVQCSVGMHDISSFERYMAQLKPYYLDYKDKILPKSLNEYHLFGLNLLFLLSQNRIADFHTELELLPFNIIQTNPYIIHSVALEQYLMEGNYNKIFESKNNVPSHTYNYFMSILFNTVRDEIAKCLQVAYKKVSIVSAMEKLNFNDINEMKEFAIKKNWMLGKDNYYVFHVEGEKDTIQPLRAEEIVSYTCQYTKDLDIIV